MTIRPLTKSETLTTFETWRGHVNYTLSQDANFAQFLQDSCVWKRKSVDANRGFVDIKDETDAVTSSAIQQANFLDVFLGLLASWAPIINRSSITRDACSVREVYQKLRVYYGFSLSGSSIIDAVSLQRQSDESPEDVYQRLVSHIDTCLLSTTDELKHNGVKVSVDESMTPTLENLIICLWLKTVHPSLPQLVKTKYATQLKNCTIASIREEISASIRELLNELNERESPNSNNPVFQTSSGPSRNYPPRHSFTFSTPGSNNQGPRYNRNSPSRSFNDRSPANSGRPNYQPRRSNPQCAICKQAGRRNFNHFLSTCPFLPDDDKRFLNRARLIECLDEESDDVQYNDFVQDMSQELPHDQGNYPDFYQNQPSQYYDSSQQIPSGPHQTSAHDNNPRIEPHVLRVSTCSSPFINAFYNNHSIKIVLDTGATVNLINERLARYLNLNISPSSQTAKQADGISDLSVVGESRFSLYRNSIELKFEGLVVRGLESEILAGIPFLRCNDISVRPSRNEINIGDTSITYDSKSQSPNYCLRVNSAPVICDSPQTLFPSEFIEVRCNNTQLDTSVVIHPHPDASWLNPQIIHSVDGKVRITNSSNLPVILEKTQLVASVTNISDDDIPDSSSSTFTSNADESVPSSLIPIPTIKINPQNMNIDPAWLPRFEALHQIHAPVFGDDIPGYNGKFGAVTAYVNIGNSLPPQRKGRLPQYSRNLLSELQSQFDTLESSGVFATPESVDTHAEYVNPSFLVKRPEGGYRLVTSFGEVAAHNKPTPTLTPSVDSTLRSLGGWKYLIKSDLRKAYFQIPLHPDSRRYCAVVTPYKGVRVYCRAAMGMPGSESALDELMSRTLGDLFQDGRVTRVADDIYVGSDNLQSLFSTWEIVLKRLHQADLRLSPSKTEILPSTTTILGWIWSNGTLSASPHHISALSSCDIPKSVKALRSYLGAYKVVTRVLRNCSQFLAPLESLSAGKQSADLITWLPESITIFKKSQEHLANCTPVSIPTPNDKLWIITDACSSKSGIAATLVSTDESNSNPRLCSFFSAKLKQGHDRWLPCEIECLAVATAINHFRPLILESNHRVHVLTDSKPVVQAYDKFMRGHFSTSSRMQSFVLAATQNNVIITHIKGTNNLLSDFASRNSVACTNTSCSVCKFV